MSPTKATTIAKPASERWDAVVVGSGMGGLTAAAYLAASGKRTLVLEAGEVLGGCTHVFRRKQFEFEVGVHYLGDCGADGAIPMMLRGVGLDDRVEFLPMDPEGFDTIVYPEVTVKVPKGWDRYEANLIAAFPRMRTASASTSESSAASARRQTGSPPPEACVARPPSQ